MVEKVTQKAMIIALVLGVLGALVMGIGMSMIMTEIGVAFGIPVLACMMIGGAIGVIGIVMMALAYPVYRKVLKTEREKIAPEILELTEELMNAKDAKGDPAYNFGVILNYLFNEKALEGLLDGNLPLHIVEKKIPYLNEAGELVKPEEPNGYKFENLVLDMIHQLDTCLPYEVVREKEFAPIKNKTGVDSVESAKALLKQNGVVL